MSAAESCYLERKPTFRLLADIMDAEKAKATGTSTIAGKTVVRNGFDRNSSTDLKTEDLMSKMSVEPDPKLIAPRQLTGVEIKERQDSFREFLKNNFDLISYCGNYKTTAWEDSYKEAKKLVGCSVKWKSCVVYIGAAIGGLTSNSSHNFQRINDFAISVLGYVKSQEDWTDDKRRSFELSATEIRLNDVQFQSLETKGYGVIVSAIAVIALASFA